MCVRAPGRSSPGRGVNRTCAWYHRDMTLTVLVTGASGFVGSKLVPRLLARGHEVRAMTRRPQEYTGAGTAVAGDVTDPASLGAALRGVDVAYYLVHSLGLDDFVER